MRHGHWRQNMNGRQGKVRLECVAWHRGRFSAALTPPFRRAVPPTSPKKRDGHFVAFLECHLNISSATVSTEGCASTFSLLCHEPYCVVVVTLSLTLPFQQNPNGRGGGRQLAAWGNELRATRVHSHGQWHALRRTGVLVSQRVMVRCKDVSEIHQRAAGRCPQPLAAPAVFGRQPAAADAPADVIPGQCPLCVHTTSVPHTRSNVSFCVRPDACSGVQNMAQAAASAATTTTTTGLMHVYTITSSDHQNSDMHRYTDVQPHAHLHVTGQWVVHWKRASPVPSAQCWAVAAPRQCASRVGLPPAFCLWVPGMCRCANLCHHPLGWFPLAVSLPPFSVFRVRVRGGHSFLGA
jgi:hypothetical protein